MSNNSDPKSVIQQTPANLTGKAQVNLDKTDFDAAIQQKGYDVYIDRAIECPCKSKGAGNLSNCRNCNGSGYVYINRYKTRIVLQSMNLNTKFKEWSEENLGTATVTARDVEELAYMDRITLLNAESRHSQVLFLQEYQGKLIGRSTYSIKRIHEMFLFKAVDVPLLRLKQDVDYTIEKNIVTFSDAIKREYSLNYNYSYINTPEASKPTLSVAIRYTYASQYHVIDLTREVMNTDISDANGVQKNVQMPIGAIARRSHYVIDEQNLSQDHLFDNSYAEDLCNVTIIEELKAPSELTAELSGSDVNLTWKDNSDNEMNFIVLRAIGDVELWTQLAILDPETTTYTDTTRVVGKMYKYQVAAYLNGRYSCFVTSKLI